MFLVLQVAPSQPKVYSTAWSCAKGDKVAAANEARKMCLAQEHLHEFIVTEYAKLKCSVTANSWLVVVSICILGG